MPTPTLLLIDIQNDYFPGGKWTLDGMEAAASNAAKLLSAARRAGTPVIHVRHEFPSEEAPFFIAGSEGAKIYEQVAPANDESVVLKHHVNAFRETNLKDVLDEIGTERLTICGAMSHMCVDAGTRAAADLGYDLTVVHDACATRDQEFGGTFVPAAQVHASFMAALGFAYANVVSTNDYLA
ncbi:cysteine hydrolase family protein [Stratiformator vulcanicus]|uniref:Streptothricin hydrolase n=1 Tax=Stratiformator vulcanicus TaxID=2527980 RepID=A0A517QZP8_9PLAN|nr:cysteine hydrolase family protein [Stratiformator vulcanicus]QDT37122.1 Streptothricin hydrolase [Stratiformator vulcanicus]